MSKVSGRGDTAKIETRRSPSRSTTKVTRRTSPVLREKSQRSQSNSRRSPSRKTAPRKLSRDKSSSPVNVRKTPNRSNSASRKISSRQSPSRRSPARNVKAEPKKIDKDIPKSKSAPKITVIDSDSETLEFEKKEKPKATVRGRSRFSDEEKVQEVTDEYYKNSVITRRTTAKLAQLKENERIVHLKDNELAKSNLMEYSDEDEKEKNEFLLPYKKQPSLIEFGGNIGAAFWIFFLPLFTIGINVICNEKNCNWKNYTLHERFLKIDTYFDSITYASCLGFFTLFLILNALPIGGKKVTGLLNKHGKFVYCTNGLFIITVLLLIAFGFEYYNVKLFSFLYNKYLKITTFFLILSILISVYFYVRSFYVPLSALNTHIVNNAPLYNFFMGREVNPRLFGGVLDWKMLALRYLLVTLIFLNLTYLHASFGEDFQFSKLLELKTAHLTLYCLVFMQIAYALEALIFEATWLSTYEIQTEAVGYMTIFFFFIFSHLFGLSSKSVLEHNIHLPQWQLIICTISFLAGLILTRLSDLQKNAFRLNPYSPSVAHLKSITTGQGKRLIISGYWGFVRHPNHLGQIIIFLSMLPFVISTPIAILFIGEVLALIHRALRVDRRCKETYGSSWNTYCEYVEYRLIPKIF